MLPQIGKVDRASFDRIIFPRLGRKDSSVLIGPRHGVDAAAIELSNGKVMVVAEDPTFGMPVLMPHFGWAIVHICASDVAVFGVKPRYLTICLILPPDTGEDVLEGIWKEVHEECEKLEIAIVGGSFGTRGGQNMLEPAAYGANVAFGPNTSNFKDITELLLEAGGAVRLASLETLPAWLQAELDAPEAGRARGAIARRVIHEQQGATERTLTLLSEILSGTGADET